MKGHDPAPFSTSLPAPTSRIYPSLVRPILLGGVEREVMIPVVGIALFLLFGFRFNFVTPSLAAFLIFGLLPHLRRTARRDPQGFAVLRRHVRISGFYRAQGDHDQHRQSRFPTL